MVKILAGNALKQDLKKYSNQKSLTPKEVESIQKNAIKTLDMFRNKQVDILPQDIKTMARYIEKFHNSEILYDRLQEKADFNVRAYLYNKQKSVWQKMFAPRSNEYICMTSDLMNNKIKTAKKLQSKFSANKETNRDIKKYEAMCKEADDFMNLFVESKITIDSKDYNTLKDYIRIINSYKMNEK